MLPSVKLHDEISAVAYLKERHGLTYAVRTFQKFRCVGGGPQFRKTKARVYYEEQALDQWVAEVLSPPVHTTSQLESERKDVNSSSPQTGQQRPRLEH